MKAKIKFVPFSVRKRSVVFDSPTEIECIERRDKCFADVAKKGYQCGKDCQKIAIDPEDVLQCIKDCAAAHDLAIANCERLYENCRDLVPDPPDLPQRFTKPQKDIFLLAGNTFLSISGSFTTAGLGPTTNPIPKADTNSPKPCAHGFGSGPKATTACTSVTEAGSLPSDWVFAGPALQPYCEPRGLLIRPNRTSFCLYRPVASGQPAPHETSRPRIIPLSQRAISNTPV